MCNKPIKLKILAKPVHATLPVIEGQKMHIMHTIHVHVCITNCPDSIGKIGHGLDKQSLSYIINCKSYGRNLLFATSKFFGRFCNEVPKVKYCHELTKRNFSQSSLKKVNTTFSLIQLQ